MTLPIFVDVLFALTLGLLTSQIVWCLFHIHHLKKLLTVYRNYYRSAAHDAITNLLSDAFKYSEQGISVSTSGTTEGKPFIIAIGIGPASTELAARLRFGTQEPESTPKTPTEPF